MRFRSAASSRSWSRNSSRCAAIGITLGLIIGIPMMQLFVFGFAINLNPKDLPAAIAVDDPGPYARSIVAALTNSSYFHIIGEASDPAGAADDARRQGDFCCWKSRSTSPATSCAAPVPTC